MTAVINPYAPSTTTPVVDTLKDIAQLRRELACAEARVSKLKKFHDLIGDPLDTEEVYALVGTVAALREDLAGAEWRLDQLLIARIHDNGVTTAADMPLFRR